jgi:hypothetical protein
VKKRVRLAKGSGSFPSLWQTFQGIETMHIINKDESEWLAKGAEISQAYGA